jgi:hypothetical protein
MNQTTNIDRFWTALSVAANDIVTKPNFLQVVKTCPYFEGWWMVEIARRFAEPNDMTQYYKIAGFDPLAVSKQKKHWQPDLVFERREDSSITEIGWIELKSLNLFRKIPMDSEEEKSSVYKKLRIQLHRMKKSYDDVWSCVSTLDRDSTALKWERSKDLQNYTLDEIYRRKPRELFQTVTHLVGALLLAVVPISWGEQFLKTFPENKGQRKVWAFSSNRDVESMKVYLIGLIQTLKHNDAR